MSKGDHRSLDGQECGNGLLEGSEACDDGNLVDRDGCQADCSFTEAVDAMRRIILSSSVMRMYGVSRRMLLATLLKTLLRALLWMVLTSFWVLFGEPGQSELRGWRLATQPRAETAIILIVYVKRVIF